VVVHSIVGRDSLVELEDIHRILEDLASYQDILVERATLAVRIPKVDFFPRYARI